MGVEIGESVKQWVVKGDHKTGQEYLGGDKRDTMGGKRVVEDLGGLVISLKR